MDVHRPGSRAIEDMGRDALIEKCGNQQIRRAGIDKGAPPVIIDVPGRQHRTPQEGRLNLYRWQISKPTQQGCEAGG